MRTFHFNPGKNRLLTDKPRVINILELVYIRVSILSVRQSASVLMYQHECACIRQRERESTCAISSTLRSWTPEIQGTRRPFSVSMATPMLWSGYWSREHLSSLTLAFRVGWEVSAIEVA